MLRKKTMLTLCSSYPGGMSGCDLSYKKKQSQTNTGKNNKVRSFSGKSDINYQINNC